MKRTKNVEIERYEAEVRNVWRVMGKSNGQLLGTITQLNNGRYGFISTFNTPLTKGLDEIQEFLDEWNAFEIAIKIPLINPNILHDEVVTKHKKSYEQCDAGTQIRSTNSKKTEFGQCMTKTNQIINGFYRCYQHRDTNRYPKYEKLRRCESRVTRRGSKPHQCTRTASQIIKGSHRCFQHDDTNYHPNYIGL